MTFQTRTHHTSYAAPCVKVNHDRLVISDKKKRGEVVRVDFRPLTAGDLPDATADFGKLCRDLILDTFKGLSYDDVSKQAARACKVSVSTINRVLHEGTDKPNAQALIKALVKFQGATKRGFPLGGGLFIAIGYSEDWE